MMSIMTNSADTDQMPLGSLYTSTNTGVNPGFLERGFICIDVMYRCVCVCGGGGGFALLFLAHLSRRLMGELIVYQSLRRPSVVRPSKFSNISSETTGPIKLKFHYEDSLGCGNKSLFKLSWSHDQDGRHAHIW